jgi:6-pyruvoyltetrahydropterin/6-carboxytetrahydropterin synthase
MMPGVHNGFAAWPAMRGLGRYYELTVRCVGAADPVTGYFINIKHIDQAVRQCALPLLRRHMQGGLASLTPMGGLVNELRRVVDQALHGTVAALALHLTPTAAIEAHRPPTGDHPDMPTLGPVIVRQRFEFSASHRLHVSSLSEDENRATFGKCNNPAGHGHNYQLEVAVAAAPDAKGQVVCFDALDALVDQAVIQKLDHKHLNTDVPHFRQINPSVENIAVHVFDLLASRVGQLNVALDEVSVWETGKTVCSYRGPAR